MDIYNIYICSQEYIHIHTPKKRCLFSLGSAQTKQISVHSSVKTISRE